ncbi:type II toxin-antitoxin system RelE/ParE family toxin [candidate division KSB1 bacterium]|nr:type II toxin-antitoxin system RelE/ParE family toxin [candidate division KSB1 bacterium]
MNVYLLSPADRELEDAINLYNEHFQGLGDKFFDEFIKTINLLKQTPFGWRKVGKNTRRINLKRFPYLILYIVTDEQILITCIAHQHRNPRYYIERYQ